MLFTQEEAAEWKRREDEAYTERPGDTFDVRWARKTQISKAHLNEKVARMRARPERVLRAIVTHVGERARTGVTTEELWGDEALLAGRYAAANTPEARWIVREVLRALLKVPRSWAKSAATRFFRGTGKQAGAAYPGAGILSAERGWTQREAECVVEMFYEGDFGSLFMEDASVDPYGEEGREIREEGGNHWAATRKERNDTFIQDLITRLDGEGVAEPAVPVKPEKKPRKVKVFSTGEVVTQGNIRDVPTGAHLKMVAVKYVGQYAKGTDFSGEEHTFEMVLVSRETGKLVVRPVMKGKAFGGREMPSSNLYDSDYSRDEVSTTYVDMWTGEVLDVEVARGGWKPTSTRTVHRRREGQWPNMKILSVDP